MKNFTPRKLRRKYNNKSGPGSADKARAFRRAKLISDQFIHQPAPYLEKASIVPHYAKYCDRTRDGRGLR